MAIFATEKPALQKWVEFTLYTIIIMILANIIISIITYYQTKNKIGSIGDKGIRGNRYSGDKENVKKIVELRVCQIDLTDIANTTFYIELEKIYGGVMLQYNINENKIDENQVVNFIWNKIYKNHRISLIQPKNRDNFKNLMKRKKRKQ